MQKDSANFEFIRGLRAQGLHEQRVLAAMESLPRSEFVPESEKKSAYEDHPLPIGENQTIITHFFTNNISPIVI